MQSGVTTPTVERVRQPTAHRNRALGPCLAAIVCLAACSADIHGNAVNVSASVMITSSVDVKNVQPGEAMPVHVAVSNVTLVEPSATPPPTVTDAAYLEFFIDSTDNQPVLVTAQVDVSVAIPATEPEGDHKLLCRVNKHDGTPTTSVSEIDFTVHASVQIGGAG